jgi:hypothetical protein
MWGSNNIRNEVLDQSISGNIMMKSRKRHGKQGGFRAMQMA